MNKRHTACEEEIRRLNPELMELSFGCEFISNGTLHTYVTGYSDVQRLKEDECVFIRNSDKSYIVSKKNYVFDAEIIGHPITLEAVLKALSKSNKEVIFFFNQKAGTLTFEVTYTSWVDWIIGKTFSEQTDEMKDFICDLLNITK